MAVCTTGAERASEGAHSSGPLLQIIQAILRTLRDFAHRPPLMSSGRFSLREGFKSNSARNETPCFEGAYAKENRLVTSRPLRRRFWRRGGRCFFSLCHTKCLNGRGSVVERYFQSLKTRTSPSTARFHDRGDFDKKTRQELSARRRACRCGRKRILSTTELVF
jgi:hypothetical protein